MSYAGGLRRQEVSVSEVRKDVEPGDDAPSQPTPATAKPDSTGDPQPSITAQDEAKLLRRLQMMMNMVMGVIGQDNTLSYDEAAVMVADARTAALAMFPGKELAYDLIWKPRFQRLMRERFRLV